METSERITPEAAQPQQRRVGTFTLGVTLVASGVLMAVSLFRPELDLRWALKLSPAVLICLGVETLLASRRGGKVKYDWVGMLLCFVLTGAALCMFAAAWYVSYWPEYRCYEGVITGDDKGFYMEYDAFNTPQLRLLELEAGDTVQVEVELDKGNLSLEVLKDDSREMVYHGKNLPEGNFSFGVEKTGTYEVWITGEQAAGSIHVSAGSSPEAQDA